MNHKIRPKIWLIVKENKFLRSLCLLIGLLIVLIVVLMGTTSSYQQKTQVNHEEIDKNIILFKSLQNTAQAEAKEVAENNIFLKKSFASYEEVIPFIAFLENLFSAIDPDAAIIIKSREKQIFIDHFADYSVRLDVKGNKTLFYEALDELKQSRFIINVLSFNMDYKPAGEDRLSQLDEVEFVIRLFLK